MGKFPDFLEDIILVPGNVENGVCDQVDWPMICWPFDNSELHLIINNSSDSVIFILQPNKIVCLELDDEQELKNLILDMETNSPLAIWIIGHHNSTLKFLEYETKSDLLDRTIHKWPIRSRIRESNNRLSKPTKKR